MEKPLSNIKKGVACLVPVNVTVGKCISFSNGFYLCSICNFVSEHQRAVKSHVWRHIGQKGIEYPTFDDSTSIQPQFNLSSSLKRISTVDDQVPMPCVDLKESENKRIKLCNESSYDNDISKLEVSCIDFVNNSTLDIVDNSMHREDSNEVINETDQVVCDNNSSMQLVSLSVPGIASEMEVSTQTTDERSPQYEDDHAGYATRKWLKRESSEQSNYLSNLNIEIASNEVEQSDSPGNKVWQSLLTVIEQLRQRTRSEGDTAIDDSQEIQNKNKLSIKNLTNSPDTEIIEDLCNNIEKFNGGYRCIICYYSNGSLQQMKGHMKMHRKCGVYQCCLCMFRATSRKSLQQHMLMHCRRRRFICSICKEMFFYRSQLKVHMRVHNEFNVDEEPEMRVPCENQNMAVEVPNEVVVMSTDDVKDADLCSVDEESISSKKFAKTWTCEVCAHTFLSMRALKTHQQSHESVRYVCSACNYKSSSVRSLKSHMKCHYNDRRFVEQPLEQYKCNLCGYLCHYLPSLKGHMWKHATHADFDYRLLGENAEDSCVAVDSTTGANKDSNDSLPLIVYRCCNCGFESTSRSSLDEHMVLHKDIIQKLLVMSNVPVTEG